MTKRSSFIVTILSLFILNHFCLAKEGFTQFTEEAIQFKIDTKAIINLDLGDHECTGFFISKKGHLLTNAHCVAGLIKSSHLNQVIDNGVPFLIHNKEDLPIDVTGLINIKNAEFKFTKIQILKLGDAFFDPKLSELAELQIESLEKTTQLQHADYALLKFELSESTPYLTVEPSEESASNMLWVLGYPSKTERKSGSNSDGTHLFISSGEAIENLLSSPLFLASQDQASMNGLHFLQELYLNSFAGAANYDAVEGLSGAPVFNQNGRVIGINSSGFSTISEHFPNSQMYVKISKVFEALSLDELFKDL